MVDDALDVGGNDIDRVVFPQKQSLESATVYGWLL